MIEVELHDGRVLEFPDGTADAVIDRAVKAELGLQASSVSEGSAREEPGLQLETPEVNLDDMPGYSGAVESTSKAMSNLPRSFKEEAGGMIDALTSPVETAKNIGRLAAGGAQKAWRGLGGETGGEYIPYADAVADIYADRYGSWDKAKKTFEENPVALLSDITVPLTLGGSALTMAGKAGKVGNIASKAGKAMNVAAKYADPLTYAGLLAKPVTMPIAGAAKAIGKLDRPLYASAIKGLSSFPVETQKELIDTAFRERILPNEKGYEKLQGIAKKVGSEVGKLIDERTADELSGKAPFTIDGNKLIENAANYAKEHERGPFFPSRHSQIDAAADEAAVGYGGLMDTRSAQDLKRGSQMEAAPTYDEATTVLPAKKLFAKALAYEARKAIEGNVPGVIPLNKRLEALHPLQEAVGAAIGRSASRDLFPVAPRIGGLMLASPASAAALAGLTLGRIPGVKGRVAFGLDSLKNLPKNKKVQVAKAAQRPIRAGAYTGSLLDRIAEEDKKQK